MIDHTLNIARFRQARGLSQRDLAEILGIDQSTVQRAETGHSSTKLCTLRAYAGALQMTLPELLGVVMTPEEAKFLDRFRGLSEKRKVALTHFLQDFLDAAPPERANHP